MCSFFYLFLTFELQGFFSLSFHFPYFVFLLYRITVIFHMFYLKFKSSFSIFSFTKHSYVMSKVSKLISFLFCYVLR